MRAVAVGALVALVACATPKILTPDQGPGTEFPCGVNGVVCRTATGAETGYCCPSGNICRNDGLCEFVGDDDGLLGAHQRTPQRRMMP